MSSPLEIIGILILMLAVVFTPMFGLYYLVRFIQKNIIDNLPSLEIRININREDAQYANQLLIDKFPYYKTLDERNRNRFLGRLFKFINAKYFIPSGGTVLTKEMSILISASAIQLTFGLDDYLLDTFKRIFIYPKEFYSKINKRFHKGETNLGGAIIFSWNNFTEGYKNPTNNYNLGLHEMAHALRFNKFRSDEYDKFFDLYYEKWLLIASDEYIKLSNNVPSYLRVYGGANKEEFFAVCIEHFFETPAEFKLRLPEIYKHLCILLNQDPTKPFSTNYRKAALDNTNVLSSIDEMEVPIFETTNHFWSILLSKHTVVIVLILLGIIFVQPEAEGRTVFSIIFGSALLLFLTVSFLVGKKTFYIFSNRLKISSPFNKYFHQTTSFHFDNLVMVILTETESMNEIDTFTIDYIVNGKIKTKIFNMLLPTIKIRNMADMLVKKKVAVKIEGFKNTSHWY